MPRSNDNAAPPANNFVTPERGFVDSLRSRPAEPTKVRRQRFVEYHLDPTCGAEQFVRPSMQRMMLNDFYRTLSFRNALQTSSLYGKTVLEIGAGTGVLSCFAAQTGAEHVYAIEASPFAKVARRVVEQNGLSHKITIIEAMSFDVTLPKRADILVTETLGHLGFDEGILETCEDARQRLLTDDAMILPERMRIMASPVNAPDYIEVARYWNSRPYGLDMSAVGEMANGLSYVSHFYDEARLAPPAAAHQCTLGNKPVYPLIGRAEMQINKAGVAHGIAMSFSADINAFVTLESRASPSWQEVFLPFGHPLRLNAGDILDLEFNVMKPTATTYSYTWQGGVRGDSSRLFAGHV